MPKSANLKKDNHKSKEDSTKKNIRVKFFLKNNSNKNNTKNVKTKNPKKPSTSVTFALSKNQKKITCYGYLSKERKKSSLVKLLNGKTYVVPNECLIQF